MSTLVIIRFSHAIIYLTIILGLVSYQNNLLAKMNKASKIKRLFKVNQKKYDKLRTKCLLKIKRLKVNLYIAVTIIFISHYCFEFLINKKEFYLHWFPIIMFIASILFCILAIWIKGASVLDKNKRYNETPIGF